MDIDGHLRNKTGLQKWEEIQKLTNMVIKHAHRKGVDGKTNGKVWGPLTNFGKIIPGTRFVRLQQVNWRCNRQPGQCYGESLAWTCRNGNILNSYCSNLCKENTITIRYRGEKSSFAKLPENTTEIIQIESSSEEQSTDLQSIPEMDTLSPEINPKKRQRKE
jgi:hypothetical protein